MQPEIRIALLCAACVLFGAWLASRARQWRERRRGRALQRQGARGEQRAERVLEAHGYAIRARQAEHSYQLEVNGALREIAVRFDFLVERAGETLVAEVKTGGTAPRVERAETRRQLLEYQLATGSRRVLLVDPGAGTVTEVAFPIAAAPTATGPWRALAGWAAALALAAAWYVQR
jgi:hypothetical protein